MRALAPALLLLAAPLAAQPGDAAARRAHAEGLFIEALTAHYLGDDSTAARLLDDVLDLHPDDPALLDARAEVALTDDGPAAALYFAQRAAELASDRPEVHVRLAEVLREAGRPADAVRALETARDLDASSLDVLVLLADLYAQTGQAEREREALEALVRMGDTVAARLRLSALYEGAGDRDRALEAARAAARLSPGEAAVQRRLAELADEPEAAPAPQPTADASGETLYAAGRYAEAADALLDALADDPRDLDAWALALDALARTADPRAGATADDALLLFPTVPAVLVPAAEAYAAAGRTADAETTARRGLDALDTLGGDVPDADALRARLQRVLGG